jgi:2-hydroxychromene-2-carboxylate isomerase
MRTIDYYISLNSPWTYLGSARFIEMVRRHGVSVNVKPARFGEVFAETGGLPLAKRAPARRAYRMMELKRWRDHLGLPINVEPRHFPADEAAATRAVIRTRWAGGDALALASELGRAVWEREEDIAEPATIRAACERAGVAPALIAAAEPSDAVIDGIWEANTREAIARGVFGAPSYVFADGEIFWGQDRLAFVERKLAAVSGQA